MRLSKHYTCTKPIFCSPTHRLHIQKMLPWLLFRGVQITFHQSPLNRDITAVTANLLSWWWNKVTKQVFGSFLFCELNRNKSSVHRTEQPKWVKLGEQCNITAILIIMHDIDKSIQYNKLCCMSWGNLEEAASWHPNQHGFYHCRHCHCCIIWAAAGMSWLNIIRSSWSSCIIALYAQLAAGMIGKWVNDRCRISLNHHLIMVESW